MWVGEEKETSPEHWGSGGWRKHRPPVLHVPCEGAPVQLQSWIPSLAGLGIELLPPLKIKCCGKIPEHRSLGPRTPGLAEALGSLSLSSACMFQWPDPESQRDCARTSRKNRQRVKAGWLADPLPLSTQILTQRGFLPPREAPFALSCHLSLAPSLLSLEGKRKCFTWKRLQWMRVFF